MDKVVPKNRNLNIKGKWEIEKRCLIDFSLIKPIITVLKKNCSISIKFSFCFQSQSNSTGDSLSSKLLNFSIFHHSWTRTEITITKAFYPWETPRSILTISLFSLISSKIAQATLETWNLIIYIYQTPIFWVGLGFEPIAFIFYTLDEYNFPSTRLYEHPCLLTRFWPFPRISRSPPHGRRGPISQYVPVLILAFSYSSRWYNTEVH